MRPKKRNPFIGLLILILIFGLAGFFGFKFYYEQQKNPVSTSDEPKAFVVQKGESVSSIADRLKQEGLIRSDLVFKLELKNSGKEAKIIPGDFKLSPSMKLSEVIEKLTSAPDEMWVTLLEGWRVEEMAAKLSSELGIQSSEFIKVAEEGYMFPDTYLFSPQATPETIVSVMKNTFDKKFDEELQKKIRAKGLTPEQGVILASIVEREARSEKVRTEVASILLKRLKMDMGLNADATVQYAMGYDASNKTWWRNVTLDDYKFKSPYNTYIHVGLPPSPISNPSLVSLRAVANADPNTPYLYYIHDSEGNTHYAKTLEEHNRNVQKYL